MAGRKKRGAPAAAAVKQDRADGTARVRFVYNGPAPDVRVPGVGVLKRGVPVSVRPEDAVVLSGIPGVVVVADADGAVSSDGASSAPPSPNIKPADAESAGEKSIINDDKKREA